MAGSKPVAILELDGEAFGEIARAHAGRIEGLQHGKHGLDVGNGRTQLLGDGVEVAGEITGLVDHVDQIAADHAADRIGNCQRHLFGKMIGQRRLGRDESFQIVAVVVPAGAGTRPFRIGRRRHLGGGGLLRAVIGENIFEFGAETFFHGATAGLHVLADPVGRGASVVIAVAGCRLGAGTLRLGRCRRVVVVVAFKQRIALELALHIGRQIEAGELQQLDGLHQLRRHHQRLGLAKLQSLRQSHEGFPAETGPILACFYIAGSAARWYAIPHCRNAQNLRRYLR